MTTQRRSKDHADRMKKKHTLRAVPLFTALNPTSSPQRSQFQFSSSPQFKVHAPQFTPSNSRTWVVQSPKRDPISHSSDPVPFRSVLITNRQSAIGCHTGRSRTADRAAHVAAGSCLRRWLEADCRTCRLRPTRPPQTSTHSTSHRTHHITYIAHCSGLFTIPYNSVD